jgi:hypothetical protein
MGTNSSAGVYAIASTPFLDDGRIDEHSIDRLTDFFLESGVTGITVLGQMGEADTQAGGSYGRPDEREVERVRDDVRSGLISRRRAREVYGVEITDGGDVDLEATASLRRAIANGSFEPGGDVDVARH